MKDKLYKDGITRITDPFWVTKCLNCGQAGWSVTYQSKCKKCNSKDITCKNPANIKHEKSPPS